MQWNYLHLHHTIKIKIYWVVIYLTCITVHTYYIYNVCIQKDSRKLKQKLAWYRFIKFAWKMDIKVCIERKCLNSLSTIKDKTILFEYKKLFWSQWKKWCFRVWFSALLETTLVTFIIPELHTNNQTSWKFPYIKYIAIINRSSI
jgi:hypothetical protein